MRRPALALAVSAMGLLLSSTAVLANVTADVPTAPAAPKIDAKIDASEWGTAVNFPISYAQIEKAGGTALSGATGWVGPAVDKTPDTGNIKLMWDSKYLYIAGEFNDTILSWTIEPSGVGAEGSGPMNGEDVIQVCLDPLADGTSTADVNIIDFGMTPDGTGPTYWQHWPSEEAGTFPDVKMAAAKSAKGFQFEAAVPWADFDGGAYKPKKGDLLGYGGLLLDVDNGTINELFCDFGEGANMIGTPSGWNKLTLK